MNVMLLTEHHLEFLSLKGGCTCQNATLLEITCHGSKGYAKTCEISLFSGIEKSAKRSAHKNPQNLLPP